MGPNKDPIPVPIPRQHPLFELTGPMAGVSEDMDALRRGISALIGIRKPKVGEIYYTSSTAGGFHHPAIVTAVSDTWIYYRWPFEIRERRKWVYTFAICYKKREEILA